VKREPLPDEKAGAEDGRCNSRMAEDRDMRRPDDVVLEHVVLRLKGGELRYETRAARRIEDDVSDSEKREARLTIDIVFFSILRAVSSRTIGDESRIRSFTVAN
jgi:hypothetical protein